jgi:hypothetical protein
MIDDLRKMRDEAQVLIDASNRITQTDSTQALLKSRYNKFRHWYAPANGDQWPWDKAKRPGKIHVSINILKPAVDIDSRLQSILPRVHCESPTHDPDTERRAEATEKLILSSLEETGWDVWLNDLTKVKSLLGKGVIKAFWNTEDDRPDCSIIETPENLRIGWGASDFTQMDWAIYEYHISPLQAAQQYGLSVEVKRNGDAIVTRSGTKHDDPLGQRQPMQSHQKSGDGDRQPSDYEATHVQVWDYWYKKKGDKRPLVWNAIIVGTNKGRVVVRNAQHPEMPDIPYIIIENDHKPADPDGMSTIEHLTDFQEEYNRLVSHWLQLIADNTDPAWQAVGPGADSVPAGIVPKAGQIIALGADIKIEPIEKPQNQVPLEQAIGALWDSFHKESGLPEITFGTMPGAQTSGRAMAVQIEAVQNRADPRRRRLYRGLKELILFWLFMAEERNWALPITLPASPEATEDQAQSIISPEAKPDERTVQVPVREVIKGMRRWRLTEPEITPRDNIEHANTQIQILNARGQSLQRFMDQIGVDSPLIELSKIIEERSNAALFPGDVQAQVAAAATLLQMRMQMAQMEQQMMAQGIQQGGQAQDMANQAQGAGHLQAQEHQAQPSGDQVGGGELAGLAPTGAGPGQPGSQPSLGVMQSLIRGTPEGGAQALQQTSIRRNV